jgi:hypothetical protein
MGRSCEKMHVFVEAKDRKQALKKLSFTPAVMKKVEGGYAAFEFVSEYDAWRRNT